MKIRHVIFTVGNILCLWMLCTSTHSDIYVDRAIVRLGAESGPREDVKVINNGAEDSYVQVEVFEVVEAGTEQEERIKVTDPNSITLIASPSKLVIPPNSQKLVRIVNLDPSSTKERIYRINITPVLAPLQEDAGSVVRVVVAYQLLVIVDPVQPLENLKVERSGFRLNVHNQGNTNVLMSEGKQCDENNEHCVELVPRRIYPGNQWETELVFDSPVTFKLTGFNGIREVKTQ